MQSVATRLVPALLTLVALLLAGCSDDGNPLGPGDPGDPAGPGWDSLTVDASAGWAFVAFDGAVAAATPVGAPASSEAWDMGFFATSVMLNGGAAGPAGVVGHCVCQNAGATEEQLVVLTAESEAADFEAVTAADVPSDEDAWQHDALAAAIDGWYSYDFATHTVSAAPDRVWAVRTASGDAYAKLRVTEVADATQDHAGTVTFEYALQPSPGAPFEATRAVSVDLSAGPVRFDLETGTRVSTEAGWDLWLEGWDIRVNGGVSGSGDAGAVALDDPFEAVTDASDAPAGVYAGDAFGGVFEAEPWYAYNLQGEHQIWPNYNVYLVKRGDVVYKVQLVGYYGAGGDARQITFRYELLS